MNDNVSKGPPTGSTGTTTASGDVRETVYTKGKYQLKEPFKCVNCEKVLNELTWDKRCPHCGYPYKKLLI